MKVSETCPSSNPPCLGIGHRRNGNQSLAYKSCHDLTHPTWGLLSKSELNFLSSERRRRTLKRGREIFAQNSDAEGVYCMESGFALLSRKSEDGEKTVFGVVGPGECFGYRSYFANYPHGATASALGPCRFCLIPRRSLDVLLNSNMKLARSFLRMVARDQGPRDGLRLRDPRQPIRLRLIYLLALFRARFSVEQANGELLFNLPMTRRDIAAMIGTRPETLTRALRALEREGEVQFDRRLIRVSDPRGLFDGLG